MKTLPKKSASAPPFIRRLTATLLIVIAFLVTACQKEPVTPTDEPTNPDASPFRKIDLVVHHNGSIQAVVDAASPGSVIGIEPGTYKEAVVVAKAGIKLVGIARRGGRVTIENPGDAENGITVTDEGDGFGLHNVTVKGFEENGVLLTRVDGFLLSHVSAVDNGEYGLFPVLSSNGVIEYCTASGHSDTGIYVGQSSDCKLRFNKTFANVNGLEIENCTNIQATFNVSYDNVAGIVVVLLPFLDVKSAANILVSGNLSYNNNHVNFSGSEGGLESFVPSGIGILLVGADQVTVKDNVVSGNNFVGIALVSSKIVALLAGFPVENLDIEPDPEGARIERNVLVKNGSAPPADFPLPGGDFVWDGSGTNNCWSKNVFKTSTPSPLPSCN